MSNTLLYYTFSDLLVWRALNEDQKLLPKKVKTKGVASWYSHHLHRFPGTKPVLPTHPWATRVMAMSFKLSKILIAGGRDVYTANKTKTKNKTNNNNKNPTCFHLSDSSFKNKMLKEEIIICQYVPAGSEPHCSIQSSSENLSKKLTLGPHTAPTTASPNSLRDRGKLEPSQHVVYQRITHRAGTDSIWVFVCVTSTHRASPADRGPRDRRKLPQARPHGIWHRIPLFLNSSVTQNSFFLRDTAPHATERPHLSLPCPSAIIL